MYKLYDWQCVVCRREYEALVEADEDAPACPDCGSLGAHRLLSALGTATRAQMSPAKTREMFSKAQEMRNKVQGRTPWRKSSYSQTGNE